MSDTITRQALYEKPRAGSLRMRFDGWSMKSARQRWTWFFCKAFPLLAVAALIISAGCSPREEDAPRFKGDFCELVPRQEKFEKGEETVVDALKPDDVLVAVNGYPLTKKVFDDLMLLKAKQLSQRKDSNNPFVANQLAEFKKNYIRIFVNQRLLIDRARELNLFTSAELEDKVNEIVRKRASARKMSVEKFMKSFPADFKYYLYEVEEMLLMDQLIKKHIPPLINVDDDFVAAFKKSVAEDNAATVQTNNMLRLKMAEWKSSIIGGKTTFEDVAKKYNEDEAADETRPGYWGEFERGEFDDKRVQSAVFALKVGEISDPVEDDEGFHLLKVLSIKPPERNENGRIIQDETRSVAHIYVKKLPLFIEDSESVLLPDLKRQVQLRAVDNYIENLRTNGVTRIEYPHGNSLFK